MRNIVFLIILVCSTFMATTFQIVFTSDLHERLIDNNYGPYGLIEWLKERDRSKLLIMDGGDLFDQKIQLPFFFDNRKVVMEYVGKVAYDAMVPGNHEFYFGKQWFEEYKKANSSLLAANLPDLPDYKLFEIGQKKILVIGLAGFQHVANQIEFHGGMPKDPIKSLEEIIQEIPAADYIICLSHLPHELDEKILETFSQINLVLSGHDHRGPELKKIKNSYLFEASSHAESIYLITVDLDSNEVTYEKLKLKVNESFASDQNLPVSILIAALLVILSLAWVSFNP